MTEERTSTLERVDPFYLPIFLYNDAITDEQCDTLRQYAEQLDDWGPSFETNAIYGDGNAIYTSGSKNIVDAMPDMKFHFEALMQDISTQLMHQATEGFSIGSSWFTRTKKGQTSTMHNHKNYYMSGILYLQDDNRLMLQNPNFDKTHYLFAVNEQSPYTCTTTMVAPPKNSFLLLPAYLYHQIPPYEKDDVRYSLVMNYYPTGTYGFEASLITVK